MEMNLCRPGSRELFNYGQELNLILRWDKSALRASEKCTHTYFREAEWVTNLYCSPPLTPLHCFSHTSQSPWEYPGRLQ